MKKIILILILEILFFSCSAKKDIKDSKRYFDKNNVEISKSKFKNRKFGGKTIVVSGDSINHVRLVLKEKHGKLSEMQLDKLKKYLSIEDEINNKDKLIVIIYYPGKDKSIVIKRYSGWNVFDKDYLRELNRISDVSHHWIYKDDENLKYYYKGIIDWRKDNGHLIEELFFNYNYPFSSCVVINSNGSFITHYGEFGKQKVWELSKKLKRMRRKGI